MTREEATKAAEDLNGAREGGSLYSYLAAISDPETDDWGVLRWVQKGDQIEFDAVEIWPAWKTSPHPQEKP